MNNALRYEVRYFYALKRALKKNWPRMTSPLILFIFAIIIAVSGTGFASSWTLLQIQNIFFVFIQSGRIITSTPPLNICIIVHLYLGNPVILRIHALQVVIMKLHITLTTPWQIGLLCQILTLKQEPLLQAPGQQYQLLMQEA